MRSHPSLGSSGFKRFTAPSLRSIDEKVSTPLLRKEMRYMRRIIVPVILALVVAALAAAAAFAVDSTTFKMVRSKAAVANDCLEGAKAQVDDKDAKKNPEFKPVHTFHLGLWFGSPEEADDAGCSDTVTPFDGDHEAGIQAFSTRNFPKLEGPLLSEIQ